MKRKIKKDKWMEDRGFVTSVGKSVSVSLKPSTSIFPVKKKTKTKVTTENVW